MRDCSLAGGLEVAGVPGVRISMNTKWQVDEVSVRAACVAQATMSTLQSAVLLSAISLVGCAGYGARGVTPEEPRPPEVKYYSTRPIPPGYHVETRERSGLVVGGAVLFGVSYVPSAASAAVCEVEHCGGTTGLFVPVVGPLIAALAHDTSGRRAEAGGPGKDLFWVTLMSADFALQAAGATMLLLGLTLKPKQVLVHGGLGADRVRLVPMRVAGATGLGLIGDW
jgi:hypothetical protein